MLDLTSPRLARASLWLCLPLAALTGHAADAPATAPAPRSPTVAVQPALLEPLQAARQALVDKRYADALAQLARTDAVPTLSPDERFMVEHMRALAGGGAGDVSVQLSAVARALETGKGDAALRLSLLRQAADAAFAARNLEATVGWTTRYLGEGGAAGVHNLKLAQALHLLGRQDEAAQALQALDAPAQQGRWQPPKAQFTLLEAVHAARGDDAAWLLARERRVALWPEPAAWAGLLLRRAEQPGFDPALRLDMLRLGAFVGAWREAGPWAELAERSLAAGFASEADRALGQAAQAGWLGPAHEQLRGRAAKLAAAERRPAADQLGPAMQGKSGRALFNSGWDLFSIGRRDEGLALMADGLDKGLGSTEADQRGALQLAAAQVVAGRQALAQPGLSQLAATPQPSGLADLARYWQLAGKR